MDDKNNLRGKKDIHEAMLKFGLGGIIIILIAALAFYLGNGESSLVILLIGILLIFIYIFYHIAFRKRGGG